MCAIFGFLGISDPGLLERMAIVQRHRGPDDTGYLETPHFSMGSCRLSIIDTDGGQQPLHDQSGNLSIILNGEIYNYQELRSELQSMGHVFRTRSDTEVALLAYKAWGTEFLKRLCGMFALAIYDQRNEALFLARDRSGEKPLYLWQKDSRLIFASEAKAILLASAVERRLDRGALDSYLTLRYCPEPNTLFAGITTLPAAHYLQVTRGHLARIHRYWEPPLLAVSEKCKWSKTEAIDELESRFMNAIELSLPTEEPVGAYLSGGIDSALVVAAMKRFRSQVSTYSIGFGSCQADETQQAEETAALLGASHRSIFLGPEDFNRLPEIVYQMDRPVGDPLIVAFDKLARVASNDVRVVLGGEGADELFGGYQFHRVMQLTNTYHNHCPAAIRGVLNGLVRRAPLGLLDRFFELPASLGREGRARLTDFLQGYKDRSLRSNDDLLKTLWHESERDALCTTPIASSRSMGDTYIDDKDIAFLDKLLALQWDGWLQDWALIRQDKNTMAHSVEYRLPFLNHDLIATSFRLSAKRKAYGLKDKIIERQLARRWLGNHPVTRRRKKPFYLPLDLYQNSPILRNLIHDHLNETVVRRRGLFSPQVVTSLVQRWEGGEFLVMKKIMALVILEIWQQQFLD